MKTLYTKLMSYFSTPLPTTQDGHKEWASKVVLLSKLEDGPELRANIAMTVANIKATVSSVSLNHIVNLVRKIEANKAAYYVMQEANNELKALAKKQQEEAEAAAKNSSDEQST